jgi:EAL domain-containing protein (putative c-di-GMP-specific phosphodiesterase class I)
MVHYQPVIEISTGKLSSFEALARLNGAEGEPIAPSSFIPLAERSDLILDLGERVFSIAARETAHFRKRGQHGVRIAINVSTRQFLREDFIGTISRLIAENDADPRQVTIEITESCLAENVAESISILRKLRDMGVHISIDDFGTGYSSLSYLKRFPIDTLKIDQSFIQDMENDQNDRKIVDAIISMAHGLGMKVIAEGVEKAWHLEYLRSRGCDFAQGFLFSEALSAREIENRYA